MVEWLAKSGFTNEIKKQYVNPPAKLGRFSYRRSRDLADHHGPNFLSATLLSIRATSHSLNLQVIDDVLHAADAARDLFGESAVRG